MVMYCIGKHGVKRLEILPLLLSWLEFSHNTNNLIDIFDDSVRTNRLRRTPLNDNNDMVRVFNTFREY